MTALFVVLGAMVGAPTRYLVDRAVQSRHETVFPWGTTAVNLGACLLLSLVTALSVHGHVPADVMTLIATGLCGALSTYSTFSYETLRLYQDGARFYAVAYVAVSLVGGLGAAALGWSVGTSFG